MSEGGRFGRLSDAENLALGLSLLGRSRGEIAKRSGVEKSTIDRWLAPRGEGHLPQWVDGAGPSGLERALRESGLRESLGRLGVTDADFQAALAPGSGALMLKALLRLIPRPGVPGDAAPAIGHPVRTFTDRVAGLDGRVLFGDAEAQYCEPGGEGIWLTSEFDDRLWTPFADEPEGSPGWYLGHAIWALGWNRVADLEEQGRSVWNGDLVRLCGFSEHYLDGPAYVRLHLRRTCYVAQQATAFLYRRWLELLKPLASKSRREGLAERLSGVAVRRDAAATAALDAGNGSASADARARTFEADATAIRATVDVLRSRTFPTEGLVDVARVWLADEERAFETGNLRLSRFANAVSVNVAYIASDGRLILQRRNVHNVGAGFVDWQTSAAGFISLPRDLDGLPRKPKLPSAWKAIRHETREEIGRTHLGDVTVLGGFWEGRAREIGILAYAPLGQAYNDAIGLPGEQEVVDFADLSFTLQNVFDFALDPGLGANLVEGDPHTPPRLKAWGNVMPLGAAAIVFALAHVQGGGDVGWPKLEAAWRAAAQRAKRAHANWVIEP